MLSCTPKYIRDLGKSVCKVLKDRPLKKSDITETINSICIYCINSCHQQTVYLFGAATVLSLLEICADTNHSCFR